MVRPVSYTHLDVYKRQHGRCVCPQYFFRIPGTEVCGKTVAETFGCASDDLTAGEVYAGGEGSGGTCHAVSYTHLDGYKRQDYPSPGQEDKECHLDDW